MAHPLTTVVKRSRFNRWQINFVYTFFNPGLAALKPASCLVRRKLCCKFHIFPDFLSLLFFAVFRVAYWSFFSGWQSNSSSSSDSSCTGGTMQLLTYLWFHIGDGRRTTTTMMMVRWCCYCWLGPVLQPMCSEKSLLHSTWSVHPACMRSTVAAATFWVGRYPSKRMAVFGFFFCVVFDRCWQCVSTKSEQMAFWRLSTNRRGRELIF